MKRKRNLKQKMCSLILVFCMILQMLPGMQVFAEEGKTADISGWKYQNNPSDTVKDIPEGGIQVSESGKGIIVDYTKFNNESVVIYNENAPKYENSELECDLTVQAEQAGYYRVVPIGRFVDGKNYVGLGYDTRYYYNAFKNGTVTNRNFTGDVMTTGTTYHVTLKTEGTVLTLYLNGKEVSSFDGTSSCITDAGSYAFRIWGGDQATAAGKKVLIENIEFRSLDAEKPSEILADKINVNEEVWGTENIEIAAKMQENSPLLSVVNGDVTLENGKDYDVTENAIVLHKEYIAAQADSFTLSIVFEGADAVEFKVNKIAKPTEETYVEDFSDGDISNWEKKSGTGTVSLEDGGLRITGQANLVDAASPELENAEIEIWMEALNDNGQLGIAFRDDGTNWQNIYNKDSAVQNYAFSRWNFRNSNRVNKEIALDTPFYKQGHHLKVRYIGNAVVLWVNEQIVYSGTIAEAAQAVGKMGLTTEAKADVLIKKITYRAVEPLKVSEDVSAEEITISKNGMSVALDDSFPRVLRYTLNGKTMNGSLQPYYYVTINANDYKATATVAETTASSVTYRVNVPDAGVTFDVVYTVEDNHVLDMRIKNITEGNMKVRSFALPNQMLISAKNTQEGAKLDASKGAADTHIDLTAESASKESFAMASIPTITADGLSAAMTNNAIRNLTEFAYQSFELEDGSTVTGYWTSEYLYRGWDDSRVFEDEDLYTKVILTEDTNDDDILDWQDAGNALKYLNQGKINGSEKVANSMIHIGYNFAGVVQNPYLKIADNIKRLSNYIDGFDQIFLLKGYASEGHDSGHADYANINERAGGAKDMNLAIAEMEKLNAIMGVHINHSEAYPEAKMYTNEVMSTKLGWKWLDQSNYIRREIDIMNGGMDSRLNEMFEKVPGIGFVYVDTYRDEKWAASRIARNLADEHHVIMATEEGYKLDRWTAWSHGSEGGTMHRFVYHNQKDIYGNDKVLRSGYSKSTDNGFMGWQHGNNIGNTLRQFYTEQLPQKYLMNYSLLKWTPNQEAIFADGVVSKVEDGKSNIYKDGRLIASDKLVFIPWYAADSETRNPDDADKIYHWNPSGGESTWTLPENWAGQTKVKLYQTKQNGKDLVAEVPVVDNTVTLNVEAATPYVVYKGNEEVVSVETVWSVGSPIKDTSFNTHDFSIWKKDAAFENAENIKYIYDNDGISILQMDSEKAGKVYQTMTGLESGQKYRVSVWASAENGKRANLTVKLNDGTEITQYTDNTKNTSFVHDHYAKGKKFQILWVDFVLPEGETTADIVLSAGESGETGSVKFMETRIVTTDDPGMPEGYVAYEDFEHVDQAGHGIFEPEGFAGTTHLSEANLPYTSDTINGRWSYKFNSAVRTTPSTLRMQPNTTYTMEFNLIGNGWGTVEVLAEESRNKILSQGRLQTGAHTFTFTTDDQADYIVRITSGQILDDFKVYEGNPIDKAGLEELIAEMEAVKDESYTPSTWKPFQDAISDAKDVLANDRVSRKDVDGAKEQLELAYAGLTKQANRDILSIVLEEAQKIVDSGELDTVIQTAKENFLKAWKAAKVVNDNLDAAQEEVDAAAEALLGAINNLIKAGDKTLLNELIAIAEAIDLSKYTPVSQEGFAEALAKAVEVRDNGDAIEEMVQEAATALQEAIDKLVAKADKERLRYAVELAKDYDLSLYVEDGQDVFNAALKAAEEALADENISQAEVDRIKEELVRAMTGLRKKANKENLENVLESAKKLDLSVYTEESVKVMTEVLARAEAIFKDQTIDESKQYVVDDITAELQAAVDNLDLKEDENKDPSEETPGDKDDNNNNSNNGSDNNSNSGNSGAVQTGDNSSVVFYIMAGILAGAVLFVRRKRYFEEQ